MQFRRFLVTGGCGFLGQWLVRDLLARYREAEIKIIDLKKNDPPLFSFEDEERVQLVLEKDICSFQSVVDEFRDIDTVFHLAGCVSFSLRDKNRLRTVNVEGTRNVLQAALRHNVKAFVHVSSVAALGYNNKLNEPVDEGYRFDWNIAYAKKKYYMLTKHLADLEVKNALRQGLHSIIVYPGQMYGPGDRHNSSKVVKAISNRKIPFNMPGGTNVVDVRDVSRGILCALEKGQKARDYLLSGYNLTFAEIFGVIAEKLKVPPPSFTLPRCMNVPMSRLGYLMELVSRNGTDLTYDSIDSGFKFRYFDNSRAKYELGWEPEFSFEQTIKDTAKWMQLI